MFNELKDVFTASPGRCDLVFEQRPEASATGTGSKGKKAS